VDLALRLQEVGKEDLKEPTAGQGQMGLQEGGHHGVQGQQVF
jgi:hypothetical protein